MAYRNNFSIRSDRNNRISSLMNRLDQNLLSDLSSLNSTYSSNNLLDNYKYQNNYSTTSDFNDEILNDDSYLNNFISESSEDDEEVIKENAEQLNRADVLLQLERKKRKVLEKKLRQLHASLKKKHDNDKLCKKLSLQNRNSLQNRRFEGDGSEDDLNPGNQKTNQKSNLISSKNKNYQISSNSYQNNCPNNHRTSNYSTNQKSHLNDHLNDLNDYTSNSHNLKVKDIDKLIKMIKQQELIDKNSSSINDDRASLKSSRNSMKNIKNDLMMSSQPSRSQMNLDNQSLNSLNSLDSTILHNDLYLNENNLKRQIVNSMKTNFNSMIEFIENQSFSQDNFMAINQLINLIMMQNCQFMNHQQVLLCWLQKLQMSLSSPATISRSNNHLTNPQLSNNLHAASMDATGNYSFVVGDNQLNELNSNSTNPPPHLNNHKLTNTNNTLNNNQQIESATIKTNNYFDNLKSSHSMYQNQLNSTKMKNPLVQTANYAKQLNNKLNKQQQNASSVEKQENIRTSNQFKELYYLIEQLIENKEFKQQNATGKLVNSYQFDEPGAVGGEDTQINELNLNSLSDNLHQNNLIQSNKQSSTQTSNSLANNNNLNNNGSTTHLTNGTNGSSVVKNNSANKSPQMINLHISSSTNAVRKKTKTTNTSNSNTNSTQQQRKNPDVIESINMPDEQVKNSSNSETIRPFSAAEGRSSDPTTTTILQNQVKVLNNANNSKINPTISSSTSINSIVVAPANSSTNTNNTPHSSILLKRPPTTGGLSRLNNNFTNDVETETETDDDLAISNQTPEVNLSENNVNSTNLPNPNSNQIVESSIIDSEQQIDEKFSNSLSNSRNDSEIHLGGHRLSGDGDF